MTEKEENNLGGMKNLQMEIGWSGEKGVKLDPAVIEILIPNTNLSVGCIVEGKGKDGKPSNENGSIKYKKKQSGSENIELIEIDLEKLTLDVGYLIFVTRVLTEKVKFGDMKKGYCKLSSLVRCELTSSLNEVVLDLCEYDLTSETFAGEAVMTMGMLVRDGLEDWKIIKLGKPGISSSWEPNSPAWGRIREKIITDEIHQRMKESVMTRVTDLEKNMVEIQKDLDELEKEKIPIENAIQCKCKAIEVDKMDLFGKSDPYYIVKKGGEEIFRSEIIMVTLNPSWKTATIKKVTDVDEELEVDVYDYDRRSSDDYIGSFKFTPSKVDGGEETEFDIINPKKKKKKKNKYKNSGLFVFESFTTKVFQKKMEYYEKMEEMNTCKKLHEDWRKCLIRSKFIEGEEGEGEEED